MARRIRSRSLWQARRGLLDRFLTDKERRWVGRGGRRRLSAPQVRDMNRIAPRAQYVLLPRLSSDPDGSGGSGNPLSPLFSIGGRSPTPSLSATISLLESVKYRHILSPCVQYVLQAPSTPTADTRNPARFPMIAHPDRAIWVGIPPSPSLIFRNAASFGRRCDSCAERRFAGRQEEVASA